MNVALDRDRERSLGAMCEALRATNRLVQDESKIGAVATPVETMDYYPFGSPKFDTAASSYDGEARKFIGQFTDSTGLSYLNARYYNPSQEQFLTEDPVFLSVGNQNQVQQLAQKNQQMLLADPQALNSYSYSEDNPIVKSDPTGKQFCEDPISGAVCVSIILAGVSSGATYVGDVMHNQAVGKANPFTDNLSSPSTYVVGDLTGGSAALLPESRLLGGTVAFGSSLLQDYTNNQPLNIPKAGVAGVTTMVTGAFFNSSIGRTAVGTAQATIGRSLLESASVLTMQSLGSNNNAKSSPQSTSINWNALVLVPSVTTNNSNKTIQ